jgi:3-oxoacyl-[acyl-carrier protein] reductase
MAELFAEHEAELVVAARRVDNLERLAAATGAAACRCDVADHDDVKALVDFAADRMGGIDVAINSAGLNMKSLIRDMTPEMLKTVTEVDFWGAFWFMKHFGAYIADQGSGGSLINVTSTTAILVPVKHAAYSGSKAGINFVTKIAAREFGPQGVRVNALAPTFVPTAMNDFGGLTPVDDARVDMNGETPITEAYIRESALRRVTTVDDCANVALYLASDLSSSITGQVLPVDNGNHLMRLPDSVRS